MIITLPRWDNVTEYLSQFSEEILEEAEKQNVKYKPLKDEDANKKEFEKVLSNLNYNLLIFNGHGSPESINGQDDETIIEVGMNDSLLKERIVYARACESGAVLGKKCTQGTEQGCFIGYESKFEFWADKSWDSVPLKDETAKLFLEPSNMLAISLIKGHSAEIAHETAKKHMLKNIKKVLKNRPEDSFWLISTLWANYNCQVLYGNPSATI